MARERGSGITPQRVIDLLSIAVAEKSKLTIARETELGIAAISRYLQGIGEPTTATLTKLAAYFKVSVAWLRGESEKRELEAWELDLNAAAGLYAAHSIHSEENRAFLEKIAMIIDPEDETGPVVKECIELICEMAGDEEDAEDNPIDKLPYLREARSLLLKVNKRIRR